MDKFYPPARDTPPCDVPQRLRHASDREPGAGGGCLDQHTTPALGGLRDERDESARQWRHQSLGVGWLVGGTQIGFFAMTESNTGSDVASMKTHAIDKGDHWEVHGSKMWISQAHFGDAGLLYAYTDRTKGNKGMTAF